MARSRWRPRPLYEDMNHVTLLILHASQTNEPFLGGGDWWLIANINIMLYYASRTLAANSVPEVRGAQTDHRWLIGLQKYALTRSN